MILFHGAVLLLNCLLVLGSINILLTKDEMLKLLGVPYELYYVREGIINHNALDNYFTVPENDNTFRFVWQSTNSALVTYNIQFSDYVSELYNVSTNVVRSGVVPDYRQTVQVDVKCCGEEEPVPISCILDLCIDCPKQNSTKIVIKRRIRCSDCGKSEIAPEPETLDETSRLIEWKLYCIFVTVSMSFLLLCFCYFAECKKNTVPDRLLNSEQKERLRPKEESTPFTLSAPVAANSGTSTSSVVSRNSLQRLKYNRPPFEIQDKLSEITIPRERIRLQTIELEGTFGRVYNGTYARADGIEEEVIVKTVAEFASSTQLSLLLREGLMMYGMTHKNIMSVLGVSMVEHAEPFIIYLRDGYSNLKRFLQKCKLCSEGIAHTFTTQEIVDLTLQIISGIQYLHKNRILHKDIATRNCLVDEELNVKIADNALSRDLFPNDYHCLGDNENRPVKWLAIESLIARTFSTASDVWSFGVTMWELTTLAQQPYAEIDPFEIEHYLKDGFRLLQPVNCPDELFSMMAYCWAMSPDERPTFSQLQTCLQDFRAQLNRFV